MKKEILYVTAFDENWNLIKANDALKNNKYYCPICKNKLILKKSGKEGKGAKRPHFAHYNLTENCTPESALHYSAKYFIFQIINDYLKSKKSLNINWKCKYCHDVHKINILDGINSIKQEYNLNICIPDIALINKENNVKGVIEIVVTHNPENDVLEYYYKNNILCIEININSENDIFNIKEKLFYPDQVSICINPKCNKCGRFKIKKELIILIENCNHCNKSIKICYIFINSIQKSSYDFDKNEIEYIKKLGIDIDRFFIGTKGEIDFVNVCKYCGHM